MAVGDQRIHDISDTTVSRDDLGSRERLAWAFLLVSFAFWLAIVISVPLLVGSYLRSATQPLVLAVEANAGTVGLEDSGGRRPAVLAGDPPQLVEGEASILTSTTDEALVTLYTPDETQILARFKVNSNTSVEVVEARAPRFGLSRQGYDVRLILDRGILRLTLPSPKERPLSFQVEIPGNGELVVSEMGQYTVDASNGDTWVMVLEGAAEAEAGGETLQLSTNQGVFLDGGPPQGPLSNERDLVRNGDFGDGLSGWNAVSGQVEVGGQSAVETTVVEEDGETVLRFHRVGIGHADARVRQPLIQDVSNFSSLEIVATMRVISQSLGVCGVQGSECPLFVRLTYDDANGIEHSWQQGFYSIGQVVPDETPDVCKYCGGPISPHQWIPFGRIYVYESGNLLQKLAQQGVAPRVIKSLELVSSGHTFEARVYDVAVIAEE